MSKEIINVQSGERIDLTKSTPYEISHFLSDIVAIKKRLTDAESAIKSHIKAQNLEWADTKAAYGIANVRKSYRNIFDKKYFEANASAEEKKVQTHWKAIEEKYSVLAEIISIGK